MNKISAWLTLFEQRNLRERVLILVTSMAAVWGLWLVTLDTYVVEQKATLQSEVNQLGQEVRLLMVEQQRLAGANGGTSIETALAEKMREKDQVAANVTLQDQQIEALLKKFMEPREVPQLLRSMLRDQPDVALVSLRNHVPEEIVVDGVASGLYRHPLEVELSGTFNAIVGYLTELEGLPRGINWRAVHYQVQTHPQARVRLQIDTFSRHKAWLGV